MTPNNRQIARIRDRLRERVREYYDPETEPDPDPPAETYLTILPSSRTVH